MPIEGTKRIELDGREVFIEADQVALEEIVGAGLQLQHEIAEAKQKLDELKERALEIAIRNRFSKRSVRLIAPRAGVAKVTWGTKTDVNDEKARALKDELTAGQFKTIFTEETSYKPRRGLTGFLNTPQTPELEDLKKRIASALTFEEKTPSVKFIAVGADETPDAGDDE